MNHELLIMENQMNSTNSNTFIPFNENKNNNNNNNNKNKNLEENTPLLPILFSIYLFSFLRFIYLKIVDLVGIYTIFSLEKQTNDSDLINDKDKDIDKEKEEIPYENKYMDTYHLLSEDYFFTEEELNQHALLILDTVKTKEEKEERKKEILKTHLDKLINSILLEKTPTGNVIMFYNNSKESFEYYSDSTVPYRYLETIARKYVVTFKCKNIYIDMNKELKKYEDKCKEKQEKIEENRIIKEKEDTKKLEEGKEICNKKSVFAKFKTYNKEAGSGKINTAPPPKNSMPNINSKNNNNNDNTIQLLKEKSNRFTCMGKFANYNILKKVDLKLVNKKYNVSFAEFKKMNNLNEKYN